MHLIGFSLGAHVSGFAGAELPGLSRITGLDPAGPLFESQHPKARLDSTDANFIDVIHSNGENLILGGLGNDCLYINDCLFNKIKFNFGFKVHGSRWATLTFIPTEDEYKTDARICLLEL